MPRYEYRCSACSADSTINHLSTELMTDCPECGTRDTLKKLLSTFTTKHKRARSRPRVGEVTENFIKDARGALEQQKQVMEKKR